MPSLFAITDFSSSDARVSAFVETLIYAQSDFTLMDFFSPPCWKFMGHKWSRQGEDNLNAGVVPSDIMQMENREIMRIG